MSIPSTHPTLQKNKGRRQVLASAAALTLAPPILLLTGCGGGDASEADPSATPLIPENPGGPNPRNTSPDRTMTINITNRAQQPLTFGMPVGLDKSSPPQAQPPSIGEGETCVVVASSYTPTATDHFAWPAHPPGLTSGTSTPMGRVTPPSP